MRKKIAILCLLAIAFLTLCLLLTHFVFNERGNSSAPYDMPYFNLPTIESPYDFRVRYFSRGWSYGDYLDREAHNIHAQERSWLQDYPELLERSLRPGSFNRRAPDFRVVTSFDELNEPNLTEYAGDFFYNNYLVMIELPMPHSSLYEVVYRVTKDGTILLRPRICMGYSLSMVSYWTVIIELDNRFQPLEFNVEFISNPWAE